MNTISLPLIHAPVKASAINEIECTYGKMVRKLLDVGNAVGVRFYGQMQGLVGLLTVLVLVDMTLRGNFQKEGRVVGARKGERRIPVAGLIDPFGFVAVPCLFDRFQAVDDVVGDSGDGRVHQVLENCSLEPSEFF